MLLGGDELGRTQRGNNNAYCHDSELSWYDWEAVRRGLLDFTRRLIALRRAHPVFRRRRWFLGGACRRPRSAAPDIDWCRPDGAAHARRRSGTGRPGSHRRLPLGRSPRRRRRPARSRRLLLPLPERRRRRPGLPPARRGARRRLAASSSTPPPSEPFGPWRRGRSWRPAGASWRRADAWSSCARRPDDRTVASSSLRRQRRQMERDGERGQRALTTRSRRTSSPVARLGTGFPPDPQWYRDAIIYEVHVRAFSDGNGDGIGDFAGLTRAPRLPRRPGRHGRLAAALLPVAAARRRLRHRRLPRRPPRLRHARATSGRFIREAHRRDLRVITELVFNHTSDQHPWFQRAPARAARVGRPRLVRVERHARALSRRAHHLQGLRALQLVLGPASRAPTSGTASTATSRTSTSTSRASARALLRHRRLLARGRRRRPAPRRHPVPLRARGHQRREPARDARLPEARSARTSTSASPTACCWPRPTSGRRTRWPTSATATNATWPSTSRSCRACSWPCAWRTATPSSTSWRRRRTCPRPRSGRSSCATTTS